MSDEQNMIPELTLTPSAAAQAAPELTLTPSEPPAAPQPGQD